MTRQRSDKDLLDKLSNFLVHNKGLLVFVGVGLVALNLLLSLIVGPESSGAGFGAWLVRTDVLLHLGVIVGLLGILIGDAL
jgi:hypothetical protein